MEAKEGYGEPGVEVILNDGENVMSF